MQPYVLPPVKFKEPLLDKALAAERALAEAQQQNQGRKVPVAGILPDQAENLLDGVVYRTRKGMVERKREKTPTSPVALFTQPRNIRGQCIASSAIACIQFELLGTEVIAHHTEDMDESQINGHLFLVVRMPVKEEDGVVAMKPYLVDTTFQQFFDTDQPRWGYRIIKTNEGRQLADQLLTRGFVALDDKNADLYLDSHAQASMGIFSGNALQKLQEISNIKPVSKDFPSWDGAANDDMDIRLPSMIAAGLPKTEAIRRYHALPATDLSSVIAEGRVSAKESGKIKP